MKLSSNGYSDLMFNNAQLRETAKMLAALIPEMMRRTEADAIAVTGKSGLALAFATQMLIDFPLIVVRKDGENSHGRDIEGTRNVDIRKYIILDDFVQSGDTVRRIMKKLNELARFNVFKEPKLVGVIEYQESHSGGSKDQYAFTPHPIERACVRKLQFEVEPVVDQGFRKEFYEKTKIPDSNLCKEIKEFAGFKDYDMMLGLCDFGPRTIKEVIQLKERQDGGEFFLSDPYPQSEEPMSLKTILKSSKANPKQQDPYNSNRNTWEPIRYDGR